MLSKSIVAALFATGGLAASLSSPSRAGGLEHARSRIPKRRIIALTDIVAATREPDDIQSLIHVLATADVFQIDAIIATTGWNLESDPETPRIFELIDAYEKDLPNLMKRSGQTDFLADETNQFMGYWPSADYLRSVTAQGQTVRGMVGVGDGLTTNGSTLITAVVDRADPWNRPVWLSVWGGGNTLAQSLWDVGRTRLAHDVDEYVSKLRVYTVADQDRPFALGAGNTVGLNENNWSLYASGVQGQGALGSLYPTYLYTVEGDTASWLYPLPGISDPEDPSQSSFGGYFVRSLTPDNETYAFWDGEEVPAERSAAAVSLIAADVWNNFISRIAWAKNGTGNRNPHIVVQGDRSYDVVVKHARPGDKVTVSAAGSIDPDGDCISYSWIQDTGVLTGWPKNVTLRDADEERVSLEVPVEAAGYDIHLLLHGVDNGRPALAGWRRAIIRVGGEKRLK